VRHRWVVGFTDLAFDSFIAGRRQGVVIRAISCSIPSRRHNSALKIRYRPQCDERDSRTLQLQQLARSPEFRVRIKSPVAMVIYSFYIFDRHSESAPLRTRARDLPLSLPALPHHR